MIYYDMMDDVDPCESYKSRILYVGQFPMIAGSNSITMTHLEDISVGAQSVGSIGLIANKITKNETFYYIDHEGLEIRFEYMDELPTISGEFKFEVIGTTDHPGFMSLFEFKDKLYAGTYNAGKVKIYSYPEWEEEAIFRSCCIKWIFWFYLQLGLRHLAG